MRTTIAVLAFIATVACIVLSSSSVQGAIDGDLITALPGFEGALPSKQYSGYLEVTSTKFLHYWFVESENDPTNDPVVLWLNGGPGCSSLDGYFYEQGPLHFKDPDLGANESAQNDTVPALIVNPNRWNKIANMIFLEAPAGVGYSYYTVGDDARTNDNITAENNFEALVQFFKGFPEYANNRFFVTGESYAGIYVPTLVNQIRINNANGVSNIPLEGFIVADGCIGNSVGSCSAQGTQIKLDFLFGHGLYSQTLHAKIEQVCTDTINPSAECSELLNEMAYQVGEVDIYDIYTPCIEGDVGEKFDPLMSRARRIPTTPIDKFFVGPGPGPAGCINGIRAGQYLNNPDVRKALHVKTESEIGRWTICTDRILYDRNTVSLLPLYPTLIQNYRVTIMNGDVDACVPYNDAENWTRKLGFPVKNDWHAWFVNEQVAGYVTEFDAPNNFTFITVKGSGHMIPEYRPVQAFALFERYLNNEPY